MSWPRPNLLEDYKRFNKKLKVIQAVQKYPITKGILALRPPTRLFRLPNGRMVGGMTKVDGLGEGVASNRRSISAWFNRRFMSHNIIVEVDTYLDGRRYEVWIERADNLEKMVLGYITPVPKGHVSPEEILQCAAKLFLLVG